MTDVSGWGHHERMKKPRPPINYILRGFFDRRLDGTKGLTRARIVEVETQLRECIEAEAERVLVASDRTLLAAEREFHPTGAVARLMQADDLVFLLPIFLEPQWAPTQAQQRRVQLGLVDRLTGHLLVTGLVERYGMECPLIEIRSGIDRAKAQLRRTTA